MRTTTPPIFDVSTALAALRKALHTLEAAGSTGFEGLMRDLVAELTQTPFRLAKSGPQSGIDMRSRSSNSLQVGLESKRYAATTTLSLDELKFKLIDAATQADPVDIWMLAASREIQEPDTGILIELGAQHGLSVIILDWTTSPAGLPLVAALCASAPELCAQFLGNPPGLMGDLKEIAKHPLFAAQRATLFSELSNPDAGYASAALAVRGWMHDAQSSDRKARARLKGPNNLTEAGVILVNRPTLVALLDDWWKEAAVPSAALVGEEGNGKTWTSLAWSDGLDGETTLVLFVPARSVANGELLAAAATALEKRTGVRDEKFWRKRLSLWASAGRNAPPILIVIDGIDQNWSCNWLDTIEPLLDPAYHGLFRILLTCRPGPWAEMGGLPALQPTPRKIGVPRLSDPELNDLLGHADLKRDQFVPAVLELMRTPRLSLLAIEQRNALAASGDVTAERLIYEDWKHRLMRRRDQPQFSDSAFQKFIRQLGRDLRDAKDTFTVTRAELYDRLAKDSGRDRSDLRSTLSEIIDGRWLVVDPDDDDKFRVDKGLIHYALGLALSGDLAGALAAPEVESRIADCLDPLKGQSLAVSALRAAVTIALVDPKVERPARRGLLERWVSEQNFSRKDFDAFWRLIGLDFDLFCDLIEERWLTPEGGVFVDEIFIKGAANAHEFRDIAPRLEARIVTWLGWVWADPEDGAYLGKRDLTTPESLSNQARTRTNNAAWQAHIGSDAVWPAIEVKGKGNISWFSHRVIGIMSFLPRKPFVEALVAWALSRSIMALPSHFAELAWLLRLNREDWSHAQAAVLAAADRLAADGSKIARRGAIWLLDALGDPTADRKARQMRQAFESDFQEEVVFAEGRSRVRPRDPACPEVTVPWSPTEDKMPNGRELWLYPREQGQEDVRLKMATPKLARANQASFPTLFRDAAQSAASRDDNKLLGLAHRLARFLFLLAPQERTNLQQVLTRRAESVTEPQTKATLLSAAKLMALWSRPASEQITVIAASVPASMNEVPLAVFNLSVPADWPRLRVLVDQAKDAQSLWVWLRYVDQVVAKDQVKDWPGLVHLLFYADEDVRKRALELAFNSRNPDALRAWANGAWTAQGQADRDAHVYGSLALMAAELDLSIVVAADRMNPEVTGFALTERPTDHTRLDAFETFFKGQMDGVFRPGSRVLPQYSHTHVEALLALLTARVSTMVPWCEQWIADHADLNLSVLFDDFPVISLCRVLLDVQPKLGVRLWRMLRNRMREGIINRADFVTLLLKAGDSEPVNAVRIEALEDLDTDQKLFDFAIAAQREGRHDWLYAEIRRRMASGPSGRAFAYAIAGYLDFSEKSEALWNDLPKPDHEAVWLASVYELARASYDRSRYAHHWHRQFIEDVDATKAFAALELCYSCVDARGQMWARQELEANRGSLDLERWTHWWMNVTRLNSAAKTDRDEKKSLLFGARIMDQTQAPWL